MIFQDMYNKVNSIFPTVNIIEKPVLNYIVDTYYLYNGTILEGTSFPIYKDLIIVKDKNIQDFKSTEVIFNKDIVKVLIVPNDLDSYYFEDEKRIIIVYKIFDYICNYFYKPTSDELQLVFKHAPFILTLFTFMDMGIDIVNNSIIQDTINEVIGTNYSDDLTIELISMSIDRLLDMGGLFPIIKEMYDKGGGTE